MALYEVNHVLLGPGPVDNSKVWSRVDPESPGDRAVLKPGDKVSAEKLKELGFNVEHLLTKKDGGFSAAITLVSGTEDLVDLKSRFAPRREDAIGSTGTPANPDLVAAQPDEEPDDLNKDGKIDDLERLRVPDLMALAAERGIGTTGLNTKALLIGALRDNGV